MSRFGSRELLSQKDKRVLQIAMQQAYNSPYKQRHGAVVVVGGRIIGRGFNSYRNDPNNIQSPKDNAAVHAEIAALRDCGSTRISGGTIYVARLSADGGPAMSKPCPRCQEALSQAGISKIIYTIDSVMYLEKE